MALETVVVTQELLDEIRTPKGGYGKAELLLLGVGWPPGKGWPARVLGKPISAVNAALLTKNAAKEKRKIQKYRRFYCPECLRKFYRNNLAADGSCPFCHVPAKGNTTKVVAQVVTRMRRQRGVKPPKVKADYQVYLASPEWKAIRARVWERDGHKCLGCGARAEVVHHKSYARCVLDGFDDDALVSLCHACHGFIEFTPDSLRKSHHKNNLRDANRKLNMLLSQSKRQKLNLQLSRAVAQQQ